MLFRTSGAATATKGKGFLIDGLRPVSGAVPVAPTPPTAESQLYDGNQDCADLAPDGVTWEDFKLDAAPDNGEHEDPDSDLVITISNASDQAPTRSPMMRESGNGGPYRGARSRSGPTPLGRPGAEAVH